MALINERIKEMRSKRGLTLLQLGNAIGVKEATAQRYESGEIKNIKHETIVAIANALNCSPSYLMGWTDEGTNAKSSTIADATLRMKRESMFLECVELLLDLDEDKLTDAIQLLTILAKR